jgi:XTP/dITP diphosphohydrolase
MEFLLASGNKHKAEEFSELFDSELIKILPSPKSIDVIEDGNNYYENAFKKAKAYYDNFKRSVMSDDSGVDVDALPDELGIYSARFGGENLGFPERIKLLLKKMEGFEGEKRRASFTCVLCFYLSPDEVYYFSGKISGLLDTRSRGNDGFGYDPVFIPDELKEKDLTYAMAPEWKKDNSHRAKACKKATNFFAQTRCQNGKSAI